MFGERNRLTRRLEEGHAQPLRLSGGIEKESIEVGDGDGRANKKPCPVSTCSVSRRERWSLVSTPSAMVSMPSTLPSCHQSMYERRDSLESAIPDTNERSIFKTSMGNCRR